MKHRMPRRSQLEIMCDVLTVAKEPMKPTNLMYKSNLSWKPMQQIVRKLIQLKMMMEVPPLPTTTSGEGSGAVRLDKRSSVRYQTTEKGLDVIKFRDKFGDTLKF